MGRAKDTNLLEKKVDLYRIIKTDSVPSGLFPSSIAVRLKKDATQA